MQSLFGLDLTTAQKVLVAAAVILVLLALLGLFVRQIQGGRLRLRGQGSGRTRQPRLGVVDIHDLDRQRQLVLIRRDNVEHLVMVGGASDVVIETNIVRGGGRSYAPAPAETPAADRPLPFETLLPPAEPPRSEPVPEPRRAAPPVTVAAPEPAMRQAPPVQHEPVVPFAVGAGAGIAAAAVAAAVRPEPVVTVDAPSFAREHAPPPPVSAGELDDMTRQLEEALKRPFSAVRPSRAADAQHAAPVVEPAEPVVVAHVEPEPEPQPESEPEPAVVALPPEPAFEPAPTAEPVPEPAPRQVPPHVAHDVEAELAMALGLKPEHVVAREVPAASPRFAPAPVTPPPAPVAVAPAPVIAMPAPVIAPESPVEIAEEVSVEVRPEPIVDAPEDVAADSAAEDEKAEPAVIDPFSVDAIEAEFARLLGRDPKAKS